MNNYIYTTPYENHCPYSDILNHESPIIRELRAIILSKYRVRLKYTPGAYCNSALYLNGHRHILRSDKFQPISVYDCTIIEGTPLPQGGSNRHPYPTFKEGYCIVEIDCYGIPDIHDPGVELLSIIKL